ncbi:hypothetical protein JR338_06755 [Chloroflexota bacterium]|nr:hypothetical protein JR338_06755 [Chloroflexota bacterium]
MENRQTLYQTISRYLKKGILFPVYKGLYATIPVNELDPLDLGPAVIHRFTYLSTETILAQGGVISQSIYDFTYIADISKRVSVGQWTFHYRQMKEGYLFNPIGIDSTSTHFFATLERAAADMLYYVPNYHFDSPELLDLDRMKEIQEKVGYD